MIERFRHGLTEWRRSVDPRHIIVEYDLSFLLRRPSKTTEMMEAYRLGIATRQQVADELGIEGDILPLPNGLSEFEMWELATMGKGAPYAEVDRENNLIVPDPMGGMGLPPADPNAVTDVPLNAPTDAGGAVSEALGTGPAAPAALPPRRRRRCRSGAHDARHGVAHPARHGVGGHVDGHRPGQGHACPGSGDAPGGEAVDQRRW